MLHYISVQQTFVKWGISKQNRWSCSLWPCVAMHKDYSKPADARRTKIDTGGNYGK